jgi:hypothetical protein
MIKLQNRGLNCPQCSQPFTNERAAARKVLAAVPARRLPLLIPPRINDVWPPAFVSAARSAASAAAAAASESRAESDGRPGLQAAAAAAAATAAETSTLAGSESREDNKLESDAVPLAAPRRRGTHRRPA